MQFGFWYVQHWRISLLGSLDVTGYFKVNSDIYWASKFVIVTTNFYKWVFKNMVFWRKLLCYPIFRWLFFIITCIIYLFIFSTYKIIENLSFIMILNKIVNFFKILNSFYKNYFSLWLNWIELFERFTHTKITKYEDSPVKIICCKIYTSL